MEYREYAPAPELAPFVRCLWTLSSTRAIEPSASDVESILPDGCMELVVHWGEPFARVRGGERTPQPRTFVVGQIREPFVVARSARIGVVAARFALGGAAPWLGGLPVHELTARELAIDELWPRAARELEERVAAAPSDPERAHVLERWLVARIDRTRSHAAVAHAAKWIARTRGRVEVDELCSELGLGARQVQRLFAEHVGLGPKLCARIARFQRLLEVLRDDPRESFAAHAASAGYADQAHLIRDFREFAGTTPRAWVERHTPLAGVLAGFDG